MISASKPQSIAAVTKPALPSVRAWCLADFRLQPDGSIIIRPFLPDEEFESWVRPKEAAALLGIKPKSIYQLVDEGFLVYCRPLKRALLVSVRSLRALHEATADPEFWNNLFAQDRILKAVEQTMRKRVEMSLQFDCKGGE